MHKIAHVNGEGIYASVEYLVSKRDETGIDVLVRVVNKTSKAYADDIAGVAEAAYWGVFSVSAEDFPRVNLKFVLPDVDEENVWYVHLRLIAKNVTSTD